MTQKSPEESLSDTLSSLLNDPEAIKDAAEQAADKVAGFIKKHPYQTVGAAIAVGLLAGLYFKKKNET